ncbi:hypothetical protein GALL_89770 [mine drainage metagenome]|uniref:Uncharacterized protein n=1 Tax=mine drainage metagenome TaxID=410659 RepID=A0A1J5TA12_9ZZZZ
MLLQLTLRKYSELTIGLVAITAMILVGCGGGGGSSTPAPVIDPNLTVPVQAAIASFVNNGINKSYSLTGWVNNSTANNPVPNTPITGSGSFTIGPATSGPIASGPLIGTVVLQSVGVMTGSLSSTSYVYYSTSNYTILATLASGSSNAIYYTPYAYPTTVKAGDTGSLGSGNDGFALGQSVTSVYSVASDSANSLLVTITDTLISFGGGSTVTQTIYRITTSGNMTLVSETQTSSSLGTVYQVLTFTFA